MESVHFFDPQELEVLADEYRGRFADAQPFPHVVIDDFMPEDVLTRVVGELPEPEEWDRHEGWRSARRAWFPSRPHSRAFWNPATSSCPLT